MIKKHIKLPSQDESYPTPTEAEALSLALSAQKKMTIYKIKTIPHCVCDDDISSLPLTHSFSSKNKQPSKQKNPMIISHWNI